MYVGGATSSDPTQGALGMLAGRLRRLRRCCRVLAARVRAVCVCVCVCVCVRALLATSFHIVLHCCAGDCWFISAMSLLATRDDCLAHVFECYDEKSSGAYGVICLQVCNYYAGYDWWCPQCSFFLCSFIKGTECSMY